MLNPFEEKWDYIWQSSSNAPPPLSRYNSINFVDGDAFIATLNLSPFSALGDYKIKCLEVVMSVKKYPTLNDPQFVILSGNLSGAKIYIDSNKKLSFSTGFTNVILNNVIVDDQFHKYRIERINEQYYVYFDNELAATGNAVINQYNTVEGIFNNARRAIQVYRSIKAMKI